MKRLLWAMLIAAFVLAGASAPGTASETGAPLAKIQDFAWLAGHWAGEAGEAHLEEICTKPERGQMMCMVRFTDANAVTGMEFVTLEETAGGEIEEHIRFFSPGLGENEGAKVLVLRLTKHSHSESVLENTDGKKTGARSVTLTRVSENEMGVHIRVVGDDGQERFIDARRKRAK